MTLYEIDRNRRYASLALMLAAVAMLPLHLTGLFVIMLVAAMFIRPIFPPHLCVRMRVGEKCACYQ